MFETVTLEQINAVLPNKLFSEWFALESSEQSEHVDAAKFIFNTFLGFESTNIKALALQAVYLADNPDVFTVYVNPVIKAGNTTIEKADKLKIIPSFVRNVLASEMDYRVFKDSVPVTIINDYDINLSGDIDGGTAESDFS